MNAATAHPANADHVIGVFSREALSSALAATHRAGFGPNTRVLDGARSSAARQIERLGLRVMPGSTPADDALLIVVNAPGRTAIVAELFAQLGAERTILAARSATPALVQWRLDGLSPDLRIASDADADPGS